MPVSTFKIPEKYTYLEGFGGYHQSSAIEGALPIGSNCPQKPPHGLFIERISGTSFTVPRSESLQTWMYRILPSTEQGSYEPYPSATAFNGDERVHHVPNNFIFNKFPMEQDRDWIHTLRMIGQAGSPISKTGLAYFVFSTTSDMPPNQAFSSCDGDFLIVLQNGALDIQTELGHILLRANEIAVIPRGIRYRVTLPDGPARGYVLELYQGHFKLPELGPIGSCSLANVQDFQIPTASFQQDAMTEWELLTKYNGSLFTAKQNHTPFDVVAWRGTNYPYKYDLGRFNTLGSVSYDHPDPSISTVLTAPSDHPGSAVVDFAIFPPRWEVMEDTYRAPYYHRNTMPEFVGIICPQTCERMESNDFYPFGGELINCMIPHGPDKAMHDKASNGELKPERTPGGMIRFMFESSLSIGVTDWALKVASKPKRDGFRPLFSMPTESP